MVKIKDFIIGFKNLGPSAHLCSTQTTQLLPMRAFLFTRIIKTTVKILILTIDAYWDLFKLSNSKWLILGIYFY